MFTKVNRVENGFLVQQIEEMTDGRQFATKIWIADGPEEISMILQKIFAHYDPLTISTGQPVGSTQSAAGPTEPREVIRPW